MIITFCGHSNYSYSEKDKIRLKEILVKEVKKNPSCKFYLGGYGEFDDLCRATLIELKKTFAKIEILFISPYLDENYYKFKNASLYYDGSIYPPIESAPKKLAIIKRNEWMVEHADLLVAFVRYSFGGAAQTLKFAKQKKIPVVNLYKNG